MKALYSISPPALARPSARQSGSVNVRASHGPTPRTPRRMVARAQLARPMTDQLDASAFAALLQGAKPIGGTPEGAYGGSL